MKPKLTTVILAVGILSLIAALAEIIGAPQALRIALGVPLLLVFPGFAAVYAVLPGRELSLVERAIASLGASLAISVCVSMLLAATPIGFSRDSAAAAMGIVAAVVAFCAWGRVRNSRAIDPRDRMRQRLR